MSGEYESQGQDEYRRRGPDAEFENPDRGDPARDLEPHRGTLILVMGLLGLLVCVICGILAWVWGNADLKAMDAGTMDEDGRGDTKVGKILGIISVVLNIVVLVFVILMFVLAVGAATVSQQGN